MRIVAIGAGDAFRIHPALDERSPLVDLVANLAVGVVQARVEPREPVRVLQRLAGGDLVGDPGRAGVANGARHNLARRLAWHAALRVAGGWRRRPRRALALVECDDESVAAARVRLAALLRLRPRDVIGAGAVAGFARDIDLGPRARERLRRRVIVLAQRRRMAFRAHEVPVLFDAGPVQRVARAQLLVGVKMEPALAAPGFRPRVPGNAE